ncbi:DoxX family protein [Paracoccus onubensis]|uniref:DoxX family protein n=1 Tax=Paracoccus onubensis TaxID=1675788 RepID=UPI00272F2575|nr:DoxX family protein [Paracoccus onubensis]MDP0930078.1 DoxX family protein [Paracoccus onubensis]
MIQLVLQGLVAFVFLAAGVFNLAGMMTEEMVRLGYPGYFTTIIGVAYIIGVICIYQPRFAFLQDWAFGAMAATLVGAAGTHILIGDPISSATPAIGTLAALVATYALRGRFRED